jgi:hypothetical protein
VNGSAEAKSLRQADDGNVHGRHHLLGGVVMVVSGFPA